MFVFSCSAISIARHPQPQVARRNRGTKDQTGTKNKNSPKSRTRTITLALATTGVRSQNKIFLVVPKLVVPRLVTMVTLPHLVDLLAFPPSDPVSGSAPPAPSPPYRCLPEGGRSPHRLLIIFHISQSFFICKLGLFASRDSRRFWQQLHVLARFVAPSFSNIKHRRMVPNCSPPI